MIRTALTFDATPHVMVEPYLLQTLTRTALEQRTLSVQYYSQHRNELTERKIDVLHLHNFTGDWYAIALIIGARRSEIFTWVGYGMCRRRKLFSRHRQTGAPIRICDVRIFDDAAVDVRRP
jgi:hypothetical protein